jgi:hypothetical protein
MEFSNGKKADDAILDWEAIERVIGVYNKQ